MVRPERFELPTYSSGGSQNTAGQPRIKRFERVL
jgi:hypothetical protein